ncbi:alkaline phosphatase D family protein [Aquabacterium sp. OR-4]|uniref:alkaline phosphatase D family protein n=1 Tax=Aquabacterium sp. OR-4 TaxID=2978127 RepID=UPI0028C67E3C|nr:alkaline phosphatase D family protein [Aquabacterium sp. OR-4]MDT7837756.1 alkaline phosphatase D family protein [Aquabacterium sp. OR-4]
MGRPHHVQAAASGPSRREFFKRSGAATVAAAATLPLSPLAGAATAAVFQHGVASGDPLADRVILWTRVTPPVLRSAISVQWLVATDAAFTRVVLRGQAKTHPARDYTVKVDAIGLQPGTTYYYRFTAEGADSPVGRTRTLPTGAVDHLRIAVASCSNHAYGLFNAYARIAERADLDLVLHLGDYLYEYGANQYGSLRTPEPATEMVSLSDYRQRHAQYKRDADLQAAHRQHPFVCIWDDHEITNDTWKDGAENHQAATEGDYAARVAAGLQAYYEWMPIRAVDTRDLRKNHRAFKLGNLVDLLMLEERLSGRAQPLSATIATPFGNGFVQAGSFADASRSLLGAEQESWLFNKLQTSTARWKMLGQGVMFAQLKLQGAPNAQGGGVFLNSDQWDGYNPARNRVFDVIKGQTGGPPVGNVVVLTGDIHSSWAADLSQDPHNRDLASGGYDPVSGNGSSAVEFVGTSISSPGVDGDTSGNTANLLRGINPHFKFINLHKRGYMLLDVTPARVVGEFWHVDTVQSVSHVQTLAAAFEVREGSNRLQPAAQTTPKANPPALAP